MIELSGVSFAYGTSAVLDDCDCRIGAGERVAVLGESGCGKTTLLRIVCGLEDVGGGTVSLGGEVVTGPGRFVPPHRRSVGLSFQDAALWPHLSVRRHLDLGARRGDREHEEWAARLIADLGLTGFEERYPAELSGGQARRVSVARAFAMRPRCVLLDEPTAHLDDAARSSMTAAVLALARETGCTLVWVTHDGAEAARVSDRTLRLEEGRLVG